VCVFCYGSGACFLVHRHSRGGGSITRTKLINISSYPRNIHTTPHHFNLTSLYHIDKIVSKYFDRICTVLFIIVNCIGTYNSGDFIIADAYAVPSLNKAAPDANKPALKKYGDVLPLFKVNDPNFSTPSAKLNSRKSF
jgi:hypothetical protein